MITASGATVTTAELDGLPAPVRRYLDWCGIEGQRIPTTVSIRQTGRLRSGNEKRWLPFAAEEDYTTNPPTFSWRAKVSLAGVPVIRALDSYVDGQGRMTVHLARVISLVDLHGVGMAPAALLRYLNEMVWFPAAFVLPNISWEAIDELSARVSITDAGLTATGTILFAPDGRPIEFSAPRHRHVGGGRLVLQEWATPYTEYGTMDGVRIPTAGWAEFRSGTEVSSYIELALAL